MRKPRKPGQRTVDIAVDDVEATIDVSLMMNKRKSVVDTELKLIAEIVKKEIEKHDKHKT